VKVPSHKSMDAYHVYASVDLSDMQLRDLLAADRTKLSNQNTFLAYIRTALTLFVAGVSFIQFFGNLIYEIIGFAFIPVGLVTFFVGFIRYNRLRTALRKIDHCREVPCPEFVKRNGRAPQAD
jgi:putative membrane protein